MTKKQTLHKKLFFIFTLFLVSMISLGADGTQARPSGRYCGNVYHSGYLVKVEMMFDLLSDGTLQGTMRYRDGDSMTQGTLSQISPPNGQREIIKWHDKYGTGYAFLDFSADYTKFSGAWGALEDRPKQPTHLWTGQRCQGFIS